MDDYELVIKSCKQLEDLLEKGFGAEGRGLHECVTSVENKLPHPLIKKLRFVATIRNRLVHDADFERLDNRAAFERASRESIDELKSMLKPAGKVRKGRFPTIAAIVACILLLAIAYWKFRN